MKTDFQTIPGFSKYEINSDGQVRGLQSKKLLKFKGNSNKYQMHNDKGEYKTPTADQLLSLFKKPEKVKQQPVKKQTTKKIVKKEKTKKDSNVAEKIRELYNSGLTVKEIKEKLNLNEGHYVNDVVWRIKNKPNKK